MTVHGFEVQPEEAFVERPGIREVDGCIVKVPAAVRVEAHRPEQTR